MSLICLTITLGLVGILHAKPLDCEVPAPLTVHNTTISEVLGKWYFIIAATNNTLYHKDMAEVDNSYTYVLPLNETGFYVKEHVNMRDKCEITSGGENYTLSDDHSGFNLAGDSNFTLQILTLIPDGIAMLGYRELKEEKDYYSIWLNARKKPVPQKYVEKFKSQATCLGFTENEIFLPAEKKDECPIGEEEEKKYKQQLQEYLDKHPPSNNQEEVVPPQI